MPRRGIGRAGDIGGAHGEAIDIGTVERRNIDRRTDVVREYTAERGGKRDRLGRHRRQIDMACKSGLRFFRRNHFEKLFLPRRAADRGKQIGRLSRGSFEALAHGSGLSVTSAPAGKPSL